MNNDFITPTNLLQNDNPMLYYLLPASVKRRCRALKNISLEQERLEIKHRRLRSQVCSKYLSDEQQKSLISDNNHHGTFTCPYNLQSLKIVAKKADDLKDIVNHRTALEAAKLGLTNSNNNNNNNNNDNNFNFSAMRKVLDRCESKCHELLTHLANIDWELYEFEESLTLYHASIEEAMTEYNMELTALYKRRLGIIQGEYEPTEGECMLPRYLERSRRPKYLSTERAFERYYSARYNLGSSAALANGRILGVPKFWFQTLLIALRPLEVIEISDYAALEYLVDVRYYYDTERDHQEDELMNSDYRTQVLLFYFDKNPHFSNRILSKTLHIDMSRQSGCQMFDGLWVNKKEGCSINWYQGQDLTRRPNGRMLTTPPTIATATSDDATTNDTEVPERIDSSSPSRSFFNFFGVCGLNYGRSVKHFSGDEEEPVEVELDYEVFVRFRDFIVPHAIVAYSRGNLFGFECEHESTCNESVPEKLDYLNTLFDSPTSEWSNPPSTNTNTRNN